MIKVPEEDAENIEFAHSIAKAVDNLADSNPEQYEELLQEHLRTTAAALAAKRELEKATELKRQQNLAKDGPFAELKDKAEREHIGGLVQIELGGSLAITSGIVALTGGLEYSSGEEIFAGLMIGGICLGLRGVQRAVKGSRTIQDIANMEPTLPADDARQPLNRAS